MLGVARVDDDREVKRRCSCRFIIDFVRVHIGIEAVPEGWTKSDSTTTIISMKTFLRVFQTATGRSNLLVYVTPMRWWERCTWLYQCLFLVSLGRSNLRKNWVRRLFLIQWRRIPSDSFNYARAYFEDPLEFRQSSLACLIILALRHLAIKSLPLR